MLYSLERNGRCTASLAFTCIRNNVPSSLDYAEIVLLVLFFAMSTRLFERQSKDVRLGTTFCAMFMHAQLTLCYFSHG